MAGLSPAGMQPCRLLLHPLERQLASLQAQARLQPRPVDGLQVLAKASETALSELADVLEKSPSGSDRHRLRRGVYDPFRVALRVRRAGPRATPASPRPRDRTSDGGVDRAADDRGASRDPFSVRDPRSRCD